MAKSDFIPSDIPPKPGVYVYRDVFGEVIYVGKAVNLRRRMSQYFQPSRVTRADPKLRSLISSIDTWEFYTVENEDEALILESRFIKEYAPYYNVLLRDDKRYPMLKIDPAEKFPRIHLARIRKNDGARYFGPFPHASALKDFVAFLSRWSGLRTCKTPDPGPEDRKHCLAGSVRDCCKPCIGGITDTDYMKKVEEASSILSGNVSGVLSELDSKMREYASSCRFEQAARCRDMIENVKYLCETKRRSFLKAEINNDPGMSAVRDLQAALRLKTLPLSVECFDISNIGGMFAVASLVRFENGRPAKSGYRRYHIKTVKAPDDFGSMREVVTRHFRRLLEEKKTFPDLLMVDGGKGQLSSAISALVALNAPAFPVIGLAERNEEIFIPGSSDPIVLPRTRPALKLLQAVRDEAHRFAITFNRELRLKRITESELDEIPGLGEKRKILLLKEFGSVSVLRNSSPEEIARRVPGMGAVLSETVHEYLNRRALQRQKKPQKQPAETDKL